MLAWVYLAPLTCVNQGFSVVSPQVQVQIICHFQDVQIRKATEMDLKSNEHYKIFLMTSF